MSTPRLSRYRCRYSSSARLAAAAQDRDLEDFLHVYLANRGILITPFHNMALMSPKTTHEDVDRHTEVFAAGLSELRS